MYMYLFYLSNANAGTVPVIQVYLCAHTRQKVPSTNGSISSPLNYST
jgi:hypothetical protein